MRENVLNTWSPEEGFRLSKYSHLQRATRKEFTNTTLSQHHMPWRNGLKGKQREDLTYKYFVKQARTYNPESHSLQTTPFYWINPDIPQAHIIHGNHNRKQDKNMLQLYRRAHDRSQTYIEVLKLQEEFGFEYSEAIGSLFYLMNNLWNSICRSQYRLISLTGTHHFKWNLTNDYLRRTEECRRNNSTDN